MDKRDEVADPPLVSVIWDCEAWVSGNDCRVLQTERTSDFATGFDSVRLVTDVFTDGSAYWSLQFPTRECGHGFGTGMAPEICAMFFNATTMGFGAVARSPDAEGTHVVGEQDGVQIRETPEPGGSRVRWWIRAGRVERMAQLDDLGREILVVAADWIETPFRDQTLYLPHVSRQTEYSYGRDGDRQVKSVTTKSLMFFETMVSSMDSLSQVSIPRGMCVLDGTDGAAYVEGYEPDSRLWPIERRPKPIKNDPGATFRWILGPDTHVQFSIVSIGILASFGIILGLSSHVSVGTGSRNRP